MDHSSRNIFFEASTKKFPSSDNEKVCLVKKSFFLMYFTYSVPISNSAPNKKKFNYSKNTAN